MATVLQALEGTKPPQPQVWRGRLALGLPAGTDGSSSRPALGIGEGSPEGLMEESSEKTLGAGIVEASFDGGQRSALVLTPGLRTGEEHAPGFGACSNSALLKDCWV